MKTSFSIFILIAVLIACAETSISAQVLETKSFEMKGCISAHRKENFVIKTETEFLEQIRKDASPKDCLEKLEKIDFKKYSLLGINLNTSYCRTPLGLKHQAVKIKKEKIYLINITYFEPRGVCRAMSSYDQWILVPKLPEKYNTRFVIKPASPDK